MSAFIYICGAFISFAVQQHRKFQCACMRISISIPIFISRTYTHVEAHTHIEVQKWKQKFKIKIYKHIGGALWLGDPMRKSRRDDTDKPTVSRSVGHLDCQPRFEVCYLIVICQSYCRCCHCAVAAGCLFYCTLDNTYMYINTIDEYVCLCMLTYIYRRRISFCLNKILYVCMCLCMSKCAKHVRIHKHTHTHSHPVNIKILGIS